MAAPGLSAAGITNRHSLAGIVRAHAAARDAALCLPAGARLDCEVGPPPLYYPRDCAASGSLRRLLTREQRHTDKGKYRFLLQDLSVHAEGQVLIVLPPSGPDIEAFTPRLATLRNRLSVPFGLADHRPYPGGSTAPAPPG